MVRICSETLARPAGFEPATPGLEGEPLSAHKCIFRGETRIRFNGIEKVSQAKGRHYILRVRRSSGSPFRDHRHARAVQDHSSGVRSSTERRARDMRR